MGLPMMATPAPDGDRNNDTENVQVLNSEEDYDEEMEGSYDEFDGVPIGDSTGDGNDDTELEGNRGNGNINEEEMDQIPPPIMNGHYTPVTNNLHQRHFRAHQLRGEQPSVVSTTFLPQAPQLALERNGQFYQFPSQYGLKMWLVNIQHRLGVVSSRATVEREFWRQVYRSRRRRNRRRMLYDLDHHVRHDDLGQCLPPGQISTAIRSNSLIPVHMMRVQSLWEQQTISCMAQSTPQTPMATGHPVSGPSTCMSEMVPEEPQLIIIANPSLAPPRTRGLQNYRARPSAFPSTPARIITHTLLRMRQLQDEQSLALREIELADLRAMRNWPRNQRLLATWEIAERERDLQVELIELRGRMAERQRLPEYWGGSAGLARGIGISIQRPARLLSQRARSSRALRPPMNSRQNATIRQRTPLQGQPDVEGHTLGGDNSNSHLISGGESWALRNLAYDEPEVLALADDPPRSITHASNAAVSTSGSGEEHTQTSQPRPLIVRGGPRVPGGRTWAAGWSRQPLYIMRCMIQYFFASVDRWSRQPFHALRGVMRDYNYGSRATQAQAAVLWEHERERILKAEAHMKQQLAIIDREDVSEYYEIDEVSTDSEDSVKEEILYSRPTSPSELRPAGILLQRDKTLIESSRIRMRGGSPPWTWHPSKPQGPPEKMKWRQSHYCDRDLLLEYRSWRHWDTLDEILENADKNGWEDPPPLAATGGSQGGQETSPLPESTPPTQDAATSAGPAATPELLPVLSSLVTSTLTTALKPGLDNADLNINMCWKEKGHFHKFLPCETHWPHLHHPKFNTGGSGYDQVEGISVDEFDDYLDFLAKNAEEQQQFKGPNNCAIDAENLVCTGITYDNHGKLLRSLDFILELLDKFEKQITVGVNEMEVVERSEEHGAQLLEKQEAIQMEEEIVTIAEALSSLVKIMIGEMGRHEEGCGKEEDRGDMEGEDVDTNSIGVGYDSDMDLVNVAFEKEKKEVLSDEEIEGYRLRSWKEWKLYVDEYMKSEVSERGGKVIGVEDGVGLMCEKEWDNWCLDLWGSRTPDKGIDSECDGGSEDSSGAESDGVSVLCMGTKIITN